jgi:hypothetical protein
MKVEIDGDNLAKLINEYTGIALRFIITKDKALIPKLDEQHDKIKEFIGAKA